MGIQILLTEVITPNSYFPTREREQGERRPGKNKQVCLGKTDELGDKVYDAVCRCRCSSLPFLPMAMKLPRNRIQSNFPSVSSLGVETAPMGSLLQPEVAAFCTMMEAQSRLCFPSVDSQNLQLEIIVLSTLGLRNPPIPPPSASPD